MLEKISASAGSGKTFTLTRRFLTLLKSIPAAEQNYPGSCVCRKATYSGGTRVFSEILAVTFTNKAAAEMKFRVIEALKNFALGKIDRPKSGASPSPSPSPSPAADAALSEKVYFTPAEAHFWLNTILRRYDGLNIRTIDSLLTLLVRLSSAKLGITPDFEIDFNDSAYMDPLYDSLLDQLASGDQKINRLMEECALYLIRSSTIKSFGSKNALRELVLEALAAMREYQDNGGHMPEEDDYAPLCLDKTALHSRLDGALEQLAQAAGILEAMLEKNALTPKKDFTNILQRLLAFQAGEKLPDSVYFYKNSLGDCLLKQEIPKVTENLEHAYQSFCSAVTAQIRRISVYSSALDLLPVARTAALLLPDLHALRKNSGKLTGSMLPGLAREVLNDRAAVSEACCRMGAQLNHLLIDEFQDTSRAQWNAIEQLAVECLARGGSLRYVGDKKQAIYSWRGGDSRLFDEVGALPRLSAISPNLLDVHLPGNWRSAPVIVAHNNNVFSRLEDPEAAQRVAEALLPKDFPAQVKAEAARTITRTFTRVSQTIPEERSNPAIKGFVGIQKISGSAALDFNEETGNQFKRLFTDDLMLRRKPGDIAVLVRSGDEANRVVAWLKDLDLAVVTEHSFKLSANPLIRRLVGFLRFLDYPGDDLGFWNFISGPECFGKISGLAPDKLAEWLSGIRLEQNSDSKLRSAPLYGFFKRDFTELWNLLLHPFYSQAGLLSAYDLMSELYSVYNLPGFAPEQNVYLRGFLELIHAAGEQGHYSPAAFLDFWDDQGREAKIPMPEAPEAVRILTLHKAKGLEFPVVVMPFHRFTEDKSSNLCLYKFEETVLLLKNNKDLQEQFYRQKCGSSLEKLYLLYVGWTRAAEELHLFVGGSDFDLKNAGIPKALNALLADYTFSEDGRYCSGVPAVSRAAADAAAFADFPEYARLPAQSAACPPAGTAERRSPMAWLPRLKIFRSSAPEVSYSEKTRGIFLHSCLENFHLPDSALNEAELRNLVETTVNYTLRGFSLPSDALAGARRDALDTLSWFYSLPKAGIWLRNGNREQSVMDEQGKLHRMDMLVQEGGHCYVLEYKSGKPQTEHREQLHRYMRLLVQSRAVSGRNAQSETAGLSGILIYLDARLTEEIPYA
ncbi:MAG: UvrD-helicase domain-containing protein [Deltaproteobacteria bacterium]|jgi:ATP-dependent exoDNAse (exonuclease V) beta subunit|nr:UvrD-helicase domain-containing protein [Deltaproteobacteria bacterium]